MTRGITSMGVNPIACFICMVLHVAVTGASADCNDSARIVALSLVQTSSQLRRGDQVETALPRPPQKDSALPHRDMHTYAFPDHERAFFVKERLTTRSSTLAWASRLLATTKANPEKPDQCYVLSDGWAYAMQVSLFTVCLMTLLLKWYLECPRRSMHVFALDCTKQAVAALWYHMLNMSFAMRVGELSNSRYHNAFKDTDECSWYFITFLVDTTFGLIINYMIVKFTEQLIGYESGRYWRNERSVLKVDWREFSLQLSVYCMIITVSKLIVVTFMFSSLGYWARMGVLGTSWIKDVDTRLLFVMVITPGIMDTLFFWLTDEFIKHRIAPKDVDTQPKLMPPKAG